ncbi:hypothetical protein ACP70R_047643 [Stipagrostis hirtigluma subsp. patula]
MARRQWHLIPVTTATRGRSSNKPSQFRWPNAWPRTWLSQWQRRFRHRPVASYHARDVVPAITEFLSPFATW